MIHQPRDKLCWQIQAVKEVPVVPRITDGNSILLFMLLAIHKTSGYSVEDSRNFWREVCFRLPLLSQWAHGGGSLHQLTAKHARKERGGKLCQASDLLQESKPQAQVLWAFYPVPAPPRAKHSDWDSGWEASWTGHDKALLAIRKGNNQEQNFLLCLRRQRWPVHFRRWSQDGQTLNFRQPKDYTTFSSMENLPL